MSASSTSGLTSSVYLMDRQMNRFVIFYAFVPIALLGLGSMVSISGCGTGDNVTPNDALGLTDGPKDGDSPIRDAALPVDGASDASSTRREIGADLSDGPFSTADGIDSKDDGVVGKDAAQDKTDGTIKDSAKHDAAYSDTAIDAHATSDSSSKSDRENTSMDGLTVDGYLSGTTECSTDGTCPTGFLCGKSSTAGGADVCYDETEAGCDSSDVYYCPGSDTCWSEKIACSTVIDCDDGSVSACASEKYTASCSSSVTCTLNSSSGIDGGTGEAGTTVDVCSPLSTDTDCDTCLEQSCCAELTACSNQTSCVNLLNCLLACSSTDTACATSCESSYPTGITNLAYFMTCTDSACGASCN